MSPGDVAFDLDRIGGPRGLATLVDAVLEAGDLARHMARSLEGRFVRKGDASPVTEADRAVEARLRDALRRAFPAVGFLGEEDGETSPDEGARLRFVVDPIDGTRAFIRGIPTWSVLVGLEDADEPVAGVAYLPAQDRIYVGVRGHGATGNGRPLHVATGRPLAEAAVSHGALAQFTDLGRGDALLRLAEATDTQRGFADFESYRHLLEGRVDAVVDPGVMPWDVCAAAVLVTEAGGRWSDLRGAPTIRGEGFVASNGEVHDDLVAALAW